MFNIRWCMKSTQDSESAVRPLRYVAALDNLPIKPSELGPPLNFRRGTGHVRFMIDFWRKEPTLVIMLLDGLLDFLEPRAG